MKNEKIEDGQILFHVGRPELISKKEYGLNENEGAQNRLNKTDRDGRQVEKRKKRNLAEKKKGED